jgi:ferrous iron transport protein B
LIVLYFGLYKFVGEFGAGTLVDLLENKGFKEIFNPWITQVVKHFVPFPVIQELFIGEYGIITLGIRYAVGIILPIVATFFLFFSILEDSGYFPRLALLVDRLFKALGLTGRAVIPMVLGFGCDTMATMVTRTLETVRERVIATLLLALAIPCSAQLGVIMALLSKSPGALLVWSVCLILIFLLVGLLAAKILPGETPMFYMEIPPMRLPQFSNVLTKTYTRMQWYFMEILPLFIIASILLWLGKITHFFGVMVGWMSPVMSSLGLPKETAVAFIFGFFRRDYGAAGLYDLQSQGLLNARQLTVAAVTLTLFIPCVAQFLIMKRERGWNVATGIGIFVSLFAFGSGWLLNRFLLFTSFL